MFKTFNISNKYHFYVIIDHKELLSNFTGYNDYLILGIEYKYIVI